MVAITSHRMEYNGVGGSERPTAHTHQKLIKVTPPGKTHIRIHAGYISWWEANTHTSAHALLLFLAIRFSERVGQRKSGGWRAEGIYLHHTRPTVYSESDC